MRLNKFCKSLVCMAAVCCLNLTAWAADSYLKAMKHETPVAVESADLTGGIGSRVYASFGTTVSPNGIKAVREELFLDAGEAVKFNCIYSPATASMDFGLIAPDGYFHYINITSGSVNKTIQVEERGIYTLVIRNNSSNSVTVTGLVNY